MEENERAVVELLTADRWSRIREVAYSNPKEHDFVEVSVFITHRFQ